MQICFYESKEGLRSPRRFASMLLMLRHFTVSQLRECFEAFKWVRFQQSVRWMEEIFISFHHDSRSPLNSPRKQFMFHRAVSHCLKLLEFMKGNKNQIHTWEKGGSTWWGERGKNPQMRKCFTFFQVQHFSVREEDSCCQQRLSCEHIV